MKISNFRGISAPKNRRYSFKISNFKGVDYTSPTFDVSMDRSLDMINFLRIDNVLEKREGFNHLITIKNKCIHNIWVYNSYFIIHANKDIHFVSANNFKEVKTPLKEVCLDKSVDAFIRNKKLYILSGIKFFYIDSELNQVICEEVAEIPTTTIGIIPFNLNNFIDNNRKTYDDMNNLSVYHTNELTTGFYSENEEGIEIPEVLRYKLDANFSPKNNDITRAKAQLEIYNELISLKDIELTYSTRGVKLFENQHTTLSNPVDIYFNTIPRDINVNLSDITFKIFKNEVYTSQITENIQVFNNEKRAYFWTESISLDVGEIHQDTYKIEIVYKDELQTIKKETSFTYKRIFVPSYISIIDSETINGIKKVRISNFNTGGSQLTFLVSRYSFIHQVETIYIQPNETVELDFKFPGNFDQKQQYIKFNEVIWNVHSWGLEYDFAK